MSEVGAQNPPGRFLIEDTDASREAISVSAMAQMGGGHSNVHPSITRKVWVLVEHEKAFGKVMHRLREKKKKISTSDSEEENEEDKKIAANVAHSRPTHDHRQEGKGELLQEQSLQQWIQNNYGLLSSSHEYVQSALQIALKLTEYFLEVERDDIAVPLDIIKISNVHLLMSQIEAGERIDFAWIMSRSNSLDESSSVMGSVSARLFAMGFIMYELFSAEKQLMEDVTMSKPTSVEHIDLANEAEDNVNSNDYGRRPRKKSQQQATLAGDKVSEGECVLERKGVPWPVRYLVKNLLDCGKGECCGDDAYTSFAELKQDISLMLNDPSRFVDNIQLSGSLPTLEICNKLYGPEEEMAMLDELYQQCIR